MLKSIAIVSVLTTVALAQNNPLIPQGISSGCSTFLTSLNSDTAISSCLQPLVAATAAYGPSAKSQDSSAAALTTALNNFCPSSSSCQDSTIRGKLADFYAACSQELTSNPNKDVLRTYDILYAFMPLKQAVCSKDDSGKFCVTEAKASGMSAADIQKYLWSSVGGSAKRAPSQTAFVPNTTTFATSNLPFLFLNPSMSHDDLCTTCTKSVLTAYINYESQCPYAPGMGQSPMLSGQPALYNAIKSTCGKDFLSSSVQAAGGIAGGVISGAPRTSMMADAKSMIVALGAMVIGVAAF